MLKMRFHQGDEAGGMELALRLRILETISIVVLFFKISVWIASTKNVWSAGGVVALSIVITPSEGPILE